MAQRIELDQFAPDHGAREHVQQPPARRAEDRTLGSLIKELGDDSSHLLREEVQLAKTEMREKVEVYERNAISMAIGGVLVLGAIFVLLVAVNRGLTVLLDQFMSLEVAVWLAPLILATIAGLVGMSMLKSAQKAMKREGLTPNRTMETLRTEKDWVTQQARDVRQGNVGRDRDTARHGRHDDRRHVDRRHDGGRDRYDSMEVTDG